MTSVGTTLHSGGYAAYYCVVVASSGECESGMFGSGYPPDNFLAYIEGPLTGSGGYDTWAIGGDGYVYENTASTWVKRGTLQPTSLSINTHGTYALASAGVLKQWSGSNWATVSAPTATVVSVGPNHVWLLDASGDIYYK